MASFRALVASLSFAPFYIASECPETLLKCSVSGSSNRGLLEGLEGGGGSLKLILQSVAIYHRKRKQNILASLPPIVEIEDKYASSRGVNTFSYLFLAFATYTTSINTYFCMLLSYAIGLLFSLSFVFSTAEAVRE